MIPAYEAESFILRAIQSVQSQSLSDLEIIVVDDASRDGTSEVVAREARRDPRIRHIVLPENRGPGGARNAGLIQARGEWIAVLDADDAFGPDRLSGLIAIARGTSADMVADNLYLDYPDRSELLLDPDGEQPFLVDACAFISANRGRRNQARTLYGFLQPVVRRSFLERHQIRYRELRLAEDYFFSLSCLIHGARWVVSRKPGYRYQIRTDSLTATYGADELDAMVAADARLLETEVVVSQPSVASAIDRHRADVARAAVWTRFVTRLRNREVLGALSLTVSSPAAAWTIAARSALAAPRVLYRHRFRPGAFLEARMAGRRPVVGGLSHAADRHAETKIERP